MNEHICNDTICHPMGDKKKLCPTKVPIFGSLSDEEILKVARMTKHIRYQKGANADTRGRKIRHSFHY